MFDVETTISDLTHVLLHEMKDWVIKIRMVGSLSLYSLTNAMWLIGMEEEGGE